MRGGNAYASHPNKNCHFRTRHFRTKSFNRTHVCMDARTLASTVPPIHAALLGWRKSLSPRVANVPRCLESIRRKEVRRPRSERRCVEKGRRGSASRLVFQRERLGVPFPSHSHPPIPSLPSNSETSAHLNENGGGHGEWWGAVTTPPIVDDAHDAPFEDRQPNPTTRPTHLPPPARATR